MLCLEERDTGYFIPVLGMGLSVILVWVDKLVLIYSCSLNRLVFMASLYAVC